MNSKTSNNDNNKEIDYNIANIELFAWVGEDEFKDGSYGLKQGVVPAGYIPLVAVAEHKMNRQELIDQLQLQANHYGRKIVLAQFKFDHAVIEIEPRYGVVQDGN